MAQATKDKEVSIAGAERTYDQVVASLDAQYGSASSNGDTGIEGATRRSAIKTRDAQYYAARDTSWANTLSGSTTLGTSPWTVKAISAANAQAAYSTSRASAQAAHDAAMLDAMEELNDRKYESALDAHNSQAISVETYQMSIEQAIYLYNSNPALTDAQGKSATQVKDKTWEIPNLLGNILFGPPLSQFVAIPQEGAPARPQTPTIFDRLADWLIIDQDDLFETSIPKEEPTKQESKTEISNLPEELKALLENPDDNTIKTWFPIGHHWAPINVLVRLFANGHLDLRQVSIFAALTSGPLKNGHDYSMVYNNVTHSRYDKEVYKIMQEWATSKEWQKNTTRSH